MLPHGMPVIIAGLNSGGNLPPATVMALLNEIVLPSIAPVAQIHAGLPLRSKVNQHIHALVASRRSSMIPWPDSAGLYHDPDSRGPSVKPVSPRRRNTLSK